MPFPKSVCVIGAAGGLGSGILAVCRANQIPFTAVVRSRPERIVDVPAGSRVVVVTSLGDRAALADAFRGTEAVLSANGPTSTSSDPSAFFSSNFTAIEGACHDASVSRVVIVNSIASKKPGGASSFMHWIFPLFEWVPGPMGVGVAEMRNVVTGLDAGALGSLDWTLVRAAVNGRGENVAPVAARDWTPDTKNSVSPVGYEAMGRWMLEEAHDRKWVKEMPLVSRGSS
jgi:nucleoside-diphosphate-sugar epimerase